MKHIVGLSGGIDSQVAAGWVLDRYPAEDVIILNSDAGGNEHPLTTEHVEEYSAKVHPVIVVKAKVSDLWITEDFAETKGLDGDELLDFPRLIELKGVPLRKRRTCTEFLKLAPQRRWMRENLPDGDYVRYSGNRRDESEARKDTQFQSWDRYFDCELFSPLFDWTKDQVFVEAKLRKEPINPLYSLGFERVGCAPCIMSGKEDITRWAQRFPEMIDKLRGWEKRTGYKFFQKGGMDVDEVVEWARTDRGGYQFNILRGLDMPSCESKYGLCE